uniref:50S ribosomal protein L35 n=1 Tax=Globodera pallida TaxID=36090 RepID=A0A183CRD2_GLOPA
IKSLYVNVNCPFFYNASTPLPSRHCSWSMLNTALLTWSIFSTLHWLCLLGGKLRSSVIVHRRLTISPKQKMAAAKMNAMRRKMMRTKHRGGLKHRKSLIEVTEPIQKGGKLFLLSVPTTAQPTENPRPREGERSRRHCAQYASDTSSTGR